VAEPWDTGGSFKDRIVSDAVPEFFQFRQPVFRLVAGDQAGIDGADRCADDPVRFDSGFVQGLINAGLIGAERATALQYQNGLAAIRDLSLRPSAVRGGAGGLAGAVGRMRLRDRNASMAGRSFTPG
jgi:hypothetical protein